MASCIWPHKWSPTYPGTNRGGYRYLYNKRRKCVRCGKVREKTGISSSYYALQDHEVRTMRREAGVIDTELVGP